MAEEAVAELVREPSEFERLLRALELPSFAAVVGVQLLLGEAVLWKAVAGQLSGRGTQHCGAAPSEIVASPVKQTKIYGYN